MSFFHVRKNSWLPLLTAMVFLELFLTGCARNHQQIDELAGRAFGGAKFQDPLPPNPFKSDGCSCWWDGDWVECCVNHDLIYWMGGTREERKAADRQLMDCITSKGHPTMARIMYAGVRVGAVSWLPTPFRWGFGWNYPRSGPPAKRF